MQCASKTVNARRYYLNGCCQERKKPNLLIQPLPMRFKKNHLPGLLIALLITVSANAQSIPDSISRKIDSLFKQLNTSTPGSAVGIIRNDRLIFAKGYGMANLEYGIPIDPETVFHMASISKQFTGYAILVLAKQGKLSLDDDVRKYLKWFPDL